ncbi:MAG: hypothetical protein M5U28_54700 [Sandaracinaceae bacterium]|nr:hypothetical protein [Sandaracinaceae bacterium]
MRHLIVALALSCALPAVASADVPPPGLEECSGRSAGDPCTVGGMDGACEDTTCGRLDYSDGVPPRSVSYPCVLCRAGATPTTPPASSGCSIARDGSAAPWLFVLLGLTASGLGRRARSRR